MPDPNDAPDPLLSEEIRVARPAADAVQMDVVRALAEAALFGAAPPAKLGRYVLLGSRSAGGMGVVYAAYDPDLDRKVALKVVSPQRGLDARIRERLIVEARALAKLDHPNVVKVHDVTSLDDQAVIVMEWVEGATLAAWERDAHAWPEIVRVYAQAARGLVAAHGVGVVHRDFKPSNAILGDDGRVRVLDFGLARRVAPSDAFESAPPTSFTALGTTPGRADPERAGPERAGPERADPELTRAGDVLGTIAYASPEQLAGGTATPASDQFSFGVALHRALEGTAPFDGKTARELIASVRAGAIRTGERALPAWLRAVVARMLAADPARRFPSVAALLHELTRPRGWRKWRVPIAVGAVVLLTGGSAFALAARDPLAECDGGAAEVDAVWNPVERGIVDAITRAFPDDARRHVIGGLDAYRDRWTAGHRDACVAHRNGEQSAELLDRRMLCLQQRLGDLRAAIGALHVAPSADHAVNAVAGMPSIDDCGDVQQLESDQPPPPDLAHRRIVASIRAQLSSAMALDRAGHSADALTLAAAADTAAHGTSYEPIEAEAALARGRILMTLERESDAMAVLAGARTLGLQQRMFALAVQAAARIIYIESRADDPNRTAVERDVALYEPLGRSLRGDHFAWPLLLNNIGVAKMTAGDRGAALHYFQEARAALDGVAVPDFELNCVDGNLAMVTPEAAARESLAKRAWERVRAAAGESHTSTLVALEVYARYVSDPVRAIPLLEQACSGYAKFHPELKANLANCDSYLALLDDVVGNHEAELRLYEHIVEIEPPTEAAALLADGHSKVLQGDPAAAVAVWQHEVDADDASSSWWLRANAAHAEVEIASVELSRGNIAEAARWAKRAVAIYQQATGISQDNEYRLRLQRAQQLLAKLPERTSISSH